MKCVHHWIIDTHNRGQCKFCGEYKDFREDIKRVFKYADDSLRDNITLADICNKAEYYLQGSIPTEYKEAFQCTLDKIWLL